MPYGENPDNSQPGRRPQVVAMPKPEIDGMLKTLDNLRERAAAGEYETIWIFAWEPNHKLSSVECGKPNDRLRKIGAIECFKQDLINAMDTGEPSGL